MRTLVLGAGATGGYFGSRFLDAGLDVTFLVREARAATLARDGLRVHRTGGTFAAPVNTLVRVPDDAAFDLVLLSCKAYDLEASIDAIAPAVGPSTRVLPLLNGLHHLEALDARFGAERVLGGLCHISVTLDAEGAIRQTGAIDRLTFGSRDPAAHPLPATIRGALLGVPVEVAESPDVLASMWRKFAFLATLAGITTLLRGSIGAIEAVPGGAALTLRLYEECCETASRHGHAQDAGALEEGSAILTAPSSPLKASMLRDLERGSRTEVEHVLGDMLARAQAGDVDVPLLAAAVANLRVYENARRG
ncbi:ketopantoate reductase family protein [Dokdonella sp. MW10]|uniref:ketopantoate reductase family protein n=1 Tax=Dokdonella sp. MW10 TaxID=2992926 RepID=UPI003F7F417F